VAKNERTQNQVAEAGFIGQHDAQLRNGNREESPARGGHCGQVGVLAGKHADLTEELRPTVAGDERGVRVAIPLDDLGGSVQDDDQVIRLVPVGEQDVAGSHVALGAVPTQDLKLVGV
jgi:hypothetical protein